MTTKQKSHRSGNMLTTTKRNTKTGKTKTVTKSKPLKKRK
jgi:hypothetical protein